jgi:hypothetical protein
MDFARPTCRFLRIYQADTLSMRAAPDSHEATQTCRMRGMKDGVKTMPEKLVITGTVPAAVCCMA